jgi:hypothetical protein
MAFSLLLFFWGGVLLVLMLIINKAYHWSVFVVCTLIAILMWDVGFSIFAWAFWWGKGFAP